MLSIDALRTFYWPQVA